LNNQQQVDLELNDDLLGDLLNIDDLENSIGIQNLYNNFENLKSNVRRSRRSIQLARNTYDDTIFAEADINPDDLPPRPISQMEYDEIIAYHLRKYWASTSENVPKSYERLQKWEEKMMPILEAQDSHRDFDTRKYSDEILERFSGVIGNEINFSDIVSGSPLYELTRYFLVMLIMTNMGNIEIMNETNVDPSIAPRLKLLKLERHQELLL